ncbi:MAG: family 16 glycoside hydrolase [Planctomycetota bacterium]
MRFSSAAHHPALRPLLAAAIVFLACPRAPAEQPPAAPVEWLFDGTSFAGWNGDTKNTWRIEDGAIVAGSPTEATPRNEFLATNRTFGDFELRLEYKLDCVSDCNAGIQIRTVRIPNHHEVIGYQADIGPAVDGSLYDESRRNAFLATASKEAVAQALAKAKDGWNEYVIRCEGRRIRLSINGVETVDYTETDATVPQEGVIALQIHGKMVGTIRYRNIRIDEFPPLLASDFRLAPVAEGWEPSKAPTPFEGDTIRLADDPDEHGIRIRKGQLMSKSFPVEPFAFYRLRFLAQAAEKPLCAAVFLDQEGKEIVADNHDSIDTSTDWRPYALCFRGHADARQARIRLQANAGPLAVKNLRVEKITADDAAAWAAGLAAQCPVVQFEPAADRWQFLPRTMQRLATGGPLRIVMLGDSICNDTSNSLYETLLNRIYPKAKIEIVTSVRGGTGCWYYKDEGRVKPYVLDYKPDLVIIAGISHGFDVEAIHSVIRQIRQGSNCEILVLSGAIAPREVYEPIYYGSKLAAVALDDMEQFSTRMRRMCREERAEFFDIRRAWEDYMLRSYKPYDHFARDAIHGNSRGKQIVARILARYFEPKDAAR